MQSDSDWGGPQITSMVSVTNLVGLTKRCRSALVNSLNLSPNRDCLPNVQAIHTLLPRKRGPHSQYSVEELRLMNSHIRGAIQPFFVPEENRFERFRNQCVDRNANQAQYSYCDWSTVTARSYYD